MALIDIDYTYDVEVVRSNIGDPNTRFVTNSTIQSALAKYDHDIDKASILIMETMLTHFSVQADESITDEVEFKFTKLFERFKSRLEEFKSEKASTKRIPIIIGGVSLAEKNELANDRDAFLPHLLDDWRTIQEQQKLYDENNTHLFRRRGCQ